MKFYCTDCGEVLDRYVNKFRIICFRNEKW